MKYDVINTAEKFAEQHNFHYEVHSFQKSELQDENNRERQNQNWSTFEEKPGVYIFSNEDEVIYVGQGGCNSNSNVGSRLIAHWKDRPHIWDDSTDITILSWDSKDENIRRLEKHLNEKHNPKYKKRS